MISADEAKILVVLKYISDSEVNAEIEAIGKDGQRYTTPYNLRGITLEQWIKLYDMLKHAYLDANGLQVVHHFS